MVRRVLAALAVLSLVLGPVLGAAPPGTALGSNASLDANEPPLADAGLDQTVPRDAVVLLDGLGSRDPDGTIATFEWSIVAPDGSAVAPACADCARTNFTASQVGTYAVTLAVTDDDGATRNDTLYVTVTRGRGPSVAVTGPDRATVGEPVSVSASAIPGAAPLSTVRWRVAGTDLPPEALAGGRTVANLTRTFPSPGTYTVSATVADEDGLTASDSHAVTVVAPSPGPGPSPGPSPAPPSGGGQPSIAATADPVVRGDRVVTGDRPLRGSYRLDVPGGTGDVEFVAWHAETGRFAGGHRVDRSWAPGDHELFAVVRYRDGSRDVATFPDGSRRVVADPRPNLTLDRLDANGSISGAVTGSDGYGNLRSISVVVDGESVARWPSGLDRLRETGARRRRVLFRYRDFVSGRPHQVRFVARDGRGQTATIERRVTPVARPVVIRSEFVNDPVDSYHERIDPERYTAHHVLVVDSGGVARENIRINYDLKDSNAVYIGSERNRRQESPGKITFHSFWAAKSPGDYSLIYNIKVGGSRNSFMYRDRDQFSVTPSKPELRYTITTDGTPDQGAFGARIDASRSFDPDGTDVEYIWRLGANPISPDNATAKLSSLELATLVVEDGYDLRTRNEFFFESNYNPGLGFVEEVTEGPYLSNETVRFRVGTVAYELPKNTYSVDLGLRTSAGRGEVVRWQKREVTADMLADSGRYDHQDVGSKVWTGTVAVRASELTRQDGMPKVTVYNEQLSDTNLDSRELPGVSVLADAGTYRTNIEVTNLRYEVERPVVREVTVQSREAKEQYLADGYSVEGRSPYGTEYLVEKRVQVQAARYETRGRSFSSARNRRIFLEANPGWHAAGTETERRWRTDREYVWRSSRQGEGRYTGRTKRVRVARAVYRTMHEFRYEYRTFGGREVEGTYWAFRKRSPDHRATGRSKRVKVADSQFETRYQFEVTERERVTTVEYVAERRVQVREERHEWQEYTWTTDEAFAKQLSRLNGDYRIGGSSSTYEWTLSKQTGTEVVVVESYRNESNVLETRATVTGGMVRRYLNTETLRGQEKQVGTFEIEYSSKGMANRLEIKSEIMEETK